MKKRWLTILALACVIALVTGCGKKDEEKPAEAKNTTGNEITEENTAVPHEDPLAAAFSEGRELSLVPLEMEEPPALSGDSGSMFLDISPDGKTTVYLTWETHVETVEDSGETVSENETEAQVDTSLPGRRKTGANNQPRERHVTDYQLYAIRNGEAIPIRVNTEKGAGDPYEKLNADYFAQIGQQLPGEEGFSWSADGRYFTFSSLARAYDITGAANFDVPIVDTVAGEMWLADSYRNNNVFVPEYGAVYLTRMSRTGDYVYYLMCGPVNDQVQTCFCRCPVAGGKREVLCTAMAGETIAFDLYSCSNLFELPDGSWVMQGTAGNSRELNRMSTIFIIRFANSGNSWSAELHPTTVSAVWWPVHFDYSQNSGYGLILLRNLNSMAVTDPLTEQNENSLRASAVINHVNLMRIHPEDGFKYDVWYAQNSESEALPEYTIVDAEPFLTFYQCILRGLDAEEPEGFDWAEAIRNPNPFIINACLSPDGKYALLALHRNNYEYSLCLLRMDTMEIRPVDAPEGTANAMLTAYSRLGNAYKPRMCWKENGTLVLLTEYGIRMFRIVVE